MAGHSHDDHHVTEQKPVSFTVPFILAAVTILIMVLFLSLCDPKPHGAHHNMENPAHTNFKGEGHDAEVVEGQEKSEGDVSSGGSTSGTRVPSEEDAGATTH